MEWKLFLALWNKETSMKHHVGVLLPEDPKILLRDGDVLSQIQDLVYFCYEIPVVPQNVWS